MKTRSGSIPVMEPFFWPPFLRQLDECDVDSYSQEVVEWNEDCERTTTEAERADQRAWEEWRDRSLKGAARAAHKCLKQDRPFFCEAAVTEEGMRTGAPRHLLTKLVGAWHAEWQASPQELPISTPWLEWRADLNKEPGHHV